MQPLHAMMDKGPETMKEVSFEQSYGRELKEAHEWCKRYHKSGNVKDLNQAWDLYYKVGTNYLLKFELTAAGLCIVILSVMEN